MRPIDADELLMRPIPDRGRPDEAKSKTWNFYYGFACALHAVGDVVREMPECGPKRARWVEEQDRVRHWHCSACGTVQGIACSVMKYCPECGARMENGGQGI